MPVSLITNVHHKKFAHAPELAVQFTNITNIHACIHTQPHLSQVALGIALQITNI